ncbi:MAG: ABC transporter permease, partial [Bryobacteraceae bacterium]
MHALGDLRFAIRSLRKRPGFCLLATLTLSLGAAGAACLFSFVNAWMLKPLPNIDSERTLYIRNVQLQRGRNLGISLADLRDWREQNKSFEALAGFSNQNFALQAEAQPEMVSGVAASGDFFRVLGGTLALGRDFLPSEQTYGNHRAVIVSHGFWQTRLGGSPAALGKQLKLDGEAYTVVGVLAEKFHFPLIGRVNVWVPLALPPAEAEQRNNRFLQAIGTLRPGVSIERAKSELKGIAADSAKRFPATNQDVGVSVVTLTSEIGEHTGNDKILVLLAISVGLMLIACSNVGNLLLVRALGRRREAAIQLSLGASRGRVIGQALAESLMLFAASAIVSTLFGMWLTDWVSASIPFENRGYLPNYGVVHMDWMVFSAILSLSLLCGLAFGLGPAWEGIKVNLAGMLKDGSAAASGGRRQVWLRGTLVVGQVLLATLLLTLTGVMIQNFSALWTADPGFSSDHLLAVRVSLDPKQYATPLSRWQFADKALAALAALPLDGAPAASRFIPFGQESGGSTVLVEGRANQEARKAPSTQFNPVSNAFFATYRTPILSGRVFETRDAETSPAVVVVNDTDASAAAESVPAGRVRPDPRSRPTNRRW